MYTSSFSLFKEVDEKINFPENENSILKLWDQIDAFQTQLKKTEQCPKYTFYDGPPFATGLPHYGHIAAGTIKDVVTRYWSQTGRHVERKFGWDCHGLPIECIINKNLNITTKKDLINYGIENYNNECRKIVMQYSKEWRWYVNRLGRWIDFDQDYKTMDLKFMESVWWVFKQIYEKGLVYRKCKVMPYSWICNTVLSNFEAGMNYQNISDPSIFVKFPIVSDPNKVLLAWTTTPWTLPSNLGLAINPKLTYISIKIKGDEKQYILAEKLLSKFAKKVKIDSKYEVIDKFLGSELNGIEYESLYEIFSHYKKRGAFRVYTADYVSSEDGTGIVHVAPAFGEDDFNFGLKYKLNDPDNPPCPIDEDGFFTKEFPLVQGKRFKDADKFIIENLKERSKLFYSGSEIHKFPLCYRTNTPLMYKAIPSWFIKVGSFKESIVENNKKANWVPKYVQEKRFHNWLCDARDWCISRNRSWGNPIPLWVSDDFEEKVCVGSIKELMELTGIKNVSDLHRENIDKLTIPSKTGRGVLRRIEEVFDCWFESGSMPYAQIHYPFSIDEKEFSSRYPADFIGEGLDQTRGWFYTLNIISTALFNKPPYKNLIVNGLVLADNGEKLSKSKQNFEDPKIIFEKFGADPLRLYLINSPLVRGQSLRFSNKGLQDCIKDVFLPLYNSYRFLIQNIMRFEKMNNKVFINDFEKIKEDFSNLNITDRWIIAYNQRLIKFVRNEMENYRLYTVVNELLSFLDKLTNWYIRLNRSRIKGDLGIEDSFVSLNILYSVMMNLIILMSPFVPFITETIYQNLKKGLDVKSKFYEDSIHYLRIPEYFDSLIDQKTENIMRNMISIIELGRQLREKEGILLKKPISELHIISYDKNLLDNIKLIEKYVLDELNILEIIYINDENNYLKVSCKPNFEVLYKKNKEIKELIKEEDKEDVLEELKKDEEDSKKEANIYINVIKTLQEDEMRELIVNNQYKKNDILINIEQVLINKTFVENISKQENFCCLSNSECGIRFNTISNENILNQYYAREITNRIQKLRKETSIKISDDIIIQWNSENSKKLNWVCKNLNENIVKVTKVPFVQVITDIEYKLHEKREIIIDEEKFILAIYKK